MPNTRRFDVRLLNTYSYYRPDGLRLPQTEESHIERKPAPVKSAATIDGQRSDAIKALESLRKLDPSAVLAGGAVRDWLHGKAAKDLDFFLPDKPHLSSEQMQSWIELLTGWSVHPKHSVEYTEAGFRVYGYSDGDTRLDIVLYNQQIIPEEYIESNFNFSFNECWFDGNEVYTSANYDIYSGWDIVVGRQDITDNRIVHKYKDFLSGREVCHNISDALDLVAKKMEENSNSSGNKGDR